LNKMLQFKNNYTKENPYVLRWRYDFDKSLISVCNINGGSYDKENLSVEDKEDIEDNFGYLKSLKHFLDTVDISERMKKELSLDNGDPLFLDYVNVAWVNNDGTTFSYKQYWETSNGFVSFDCEENYVPLSNDGLFRFCNDTLPCITTIIECENLVADYRKV